MHHYVYILKSTVVDKVYIGYTTDIKRRFKEHNDGYSQFTKKYKPWRLVYCEYYSSGKDARNREKQLKRFAKAYSQLKRRIKCSLLNED